MRSIWLVAWRECRERLGTRSFLMFSTLGPLSLLALVYMLFVYGGEGKDKWNVLISDPGGLMSNHIVVNERGNLHYTFINRYIEIEEFRDKAEFQGYDAMVEINEKILSNKVAFVFYRQKPSARTNGQLRYEMEKRIEEVMIAELTDWSLKKFRSLKQTIVMKFRDVYDPKDEVSDLRGWVGLFFGTIIFVFIFLFGMTILRSVSLEKSNRIAEVLLGSISPGKLLSGKIIGIGATALLQFIIWVVVIGSGLYLMREWLFLDLLDPQNVSAQMQSGEMEQMYAGLEYNEFVDLIYQRISFSTMISFFLIFFLMAYLFYGAFFAAIGATSGSETDGQQFVIPLVMVLCIALYAGYYAMAAPESTMASVFHYLPFTSPVVAMVRLGVGYPEGEGYQIYLSLLVLLLSTVLTLLLAGRLYKNGILQHGHRVSVATWLKWLRKG
jgi:ABC-2 type transport system permease protein